MSIRKNKLLLVFFMIGFLISVSFAFGHNDTLSSAMNSNTFSIYFREILHNEIITGMGKENLAIQITDESGNIVKKLNLTEFKNYPLTNPGMFNVHVHSDHIPNIADNE